MCNKNPWDDLYLRVIYPYMLIASVELSCRLWTSKIGRHLSLYINRQLFPRALKSLKRIKKKTLAGMTQYGHIVKLYVEYVHQDRDSDDSLSHYGPRRLTATLVYISIDISFQELSNHKKRLKKNYWQLWSSMTIMSCYMYNMPIRIGILMIVHLFMDQGD